MDNAGHVASLMAHSSIAVFILNFFLLLNTKYIRLADFDKTNKSKALI